MFQILQKHNLEQCIFRSFPMYDSKSFHNVIPRDGVFQNSHDHAKNKNVITDF